MCKGAKPILPKQESTQTAGFGSNKVRIEHPIVALTLIVSMSQQVTLPLPLPLKPVLILKLQHALHLLLPKEPATLAEQFFATASKTLGDYPPDHICRQVSAKPVACAHPSPPPPHHLVDLFSSPRLPSSAIQRKCGIHSTRNRTSASGKTSAPRLHRHATSALPVPVI